MKRTLTYLFAALFLLSCTKEGEPVKPVPSDEAILFGVSASDMTKALLDDEQFQTDGTKVRVFDFLTLDGKEYEYFDEVAVCEDGLDYWAMRGTDGSNADESLYYWTHNGSHRFHGYLVHDAYSGISLPQGWGYDETARTFSVPQTRMTLDFDFDFLYSDIYVRDMDAARDYSYVPLRFKHLFTAFSFTVFNNSPNSHKLTGVTLSGINNEQSAVVDFNSASSAVTQTDEGTEDPIVSDGYEIATSSTVNLFTGEVDSKEYYLMWSQTPEQFENVTLVLEFETEISMTYYVQDNSGSYVADDVQESATGDYNRSGNEWWNYVYTYVGEGLGNYDVTFRLSTGYYDWGTKYRPVVGTTTSTDTKTLNLSDYSDGWEAGTKYSYNIVFQFDEVNLTLTVMRWDGGHGGDVTFGNNAI